ncbi:MAG: CDP-archaeol synthase [Proteobacteria bacterium]|nr:CDP-archaeol synthase [Pseudomonadota bacterium]
MLKQRIITAILLILLLLSLISIGGLTLNIFLLILYALMQWELFSFSSSFKQKERILLTSASLILPLSYLLFGYISFYLALISYFMLLTIFEIIRSENEKHFDLNSNNLLIYLLSVCYVGLFGTSLFIAVNRFESDYIYWLLITVCTTDSFAYFTGKLFGKNKITPRISPNKTIEGLIGGIIAAITVASVFKIYFNINLTNTAYIIFTLILIVVSIFGDLFESYIKRIYNKKDSGTILPGHGGVLDRIDSIIFCAPILLFVEYFLR